LNKRTYGYARVSSKEQNLGRQLIALIEQGIDERDIIVDKESGISATSRSSCNISGNAMSG